MGGEVVVRHIRERVVEMGLVPRALRRDLARTLKGLGLSGKPTIEALVTAVSAQRGKPMQIVELPGLGNCGMWLDSPAFDAVCIDKGLPPTHRQVAIGHELGHILLDHKPKPISPQLILGMFPSLPPSLVMSAIGGLGRSLDYEEKYERDAEGFGRLLVSSLDTGENPVYDPFLARLHTTLGTRAAD